MPIRSLRGMYEIGKVLLSLGWEVIETVSLAAKSVKKTCQYVPRQCSVSIATVGVYSLFREIHKSTRIFL
jgi:hypothetical protein